MFEGQRLIVTPYSKRESLERLEKGVAQTGVLSGRFTERSVTVWRGVSTEWPKPMPIFRGRFVTHRGQLALKGRFTASWHDRLASFGAAFLLIWIVYRGPIWPLVSSLVFATVVDLVLPYILYSDKRREILGTLELLLAGESDEDRAPTG